jgi:4,5-dihydroxyphthalate decarboxylase
MGKLPISIATWNYDRVRAIIDGDVRVEGCEVNHISLCPEETFFRAFGNSEFDVTEMSLSSYLIALSRGSCAYRAIPVFPSRSFRHNAIYIRTDRGIKTPQDLRGRLVGVPEYQVTAALWVRGILADEYGLGAHEVNWTTGGIEQPGRHEKLALDLPANIRVESIGSDRTLSQMLREGAIDALVTPRAPSCFMQGAPNVGRLFPNFRSVEKDYYKKTGIFPIMHVLGIRNELVEAEPWLPSAVFKAFEQAKKVCYGDLEATAALKVTLPWVTSELEETRAVMGEDFWPYGVAENRKTLDALLRYSVEQGLSKRPFTIEEIFIKSTLETVRI